MVVVLVGGGWKVSKLKFISNPTVVKVYLRLVWEKIRGLTICPGNQLNKHSDSKLNSTYVG